MSEKKGGGLSIPGQPIEEAIAEVGSEAGKSLVRGVSRLGTASTERWVLTQEAKAEAARLAIETETKIANDQALAKARREFELSEFDHQALLQRRAARLRLKLAKEQINLEAIQAKAIEFTEKDTENDKARELDEDWMFKFAEAAQTVSDQDVQTMWARVLNSAAIDQPAPPLSPLALQTLGLFDKRAAEDFRKFVGVVVRFNFVPVLRDYADPQNIDIAALMDLGLIQHQTGGEPYDLADVLIELGTSNLGLRLFKDRFFLTKKGADIGNAVFRGTDVACGEELEQQYLRLLLAKEINANGGVTVYPKVDGKIGKTSFLIEKGATSSGEGWKGEPIYRDLSSRLKQLIEWLSANYQISVRQKGS
jgi:uncharacterized protein DUF2806